MEVLAAKLYKALLRNTFLQMVVPFFALTGLILILTPEQWYPDWFFPKLTGAGGLMYAASLLGSHFVFPVDEKKNLLILERKHRSLTRLQNYFAISLLLAFAGTLGLFRWPPYDMILHFVFPLLATIALSRFIFRWWDVPLKNAILRTVLIVAGASLAWELTEFISDATLGTAAFGDAGGSNILMDTLIDCALDGLGIASGVLAVKLRKKPWPY